MHICHMDIHALDIKDCFVTIDAIGTQTKIMEKIIEKGGHFCLQLKNNHKEPFDAAKLFFDDLEQNVPRVFNSMDCYVKKSKTMADVKAENIVF